MVGRSRTTATETTIGAETRAIEPKWLLVFVYTGMLLVQ